MTVVVFPVANASVAIAVLIALVLAFLLARCYVRRRLRDAYQAGRTGEWLH